MLPALEELSVWKGNSLIKTLMWLKMENCVMFIYGGQWFLKRGWPSDKYIQSNMVCDHTEHPGFDLACTDIYICTWISSWVV